AMAINNINVRSVDEYLSNLGERTGKVIIVSVEPSNDITGRIAPALLNRSRLACITMMVSIMNHMPVWSENFLGTVIRTRVKNGELNVDVLTSDAFEGSL
ncbi:MAG: hypothetical protein OEU36_20980, partial [Gammaproteobacteria bacterium]|nr:hypothetical protein [Gammaproteobacteria bacterium]